MCVFVCLIVVTCLREFVCACRIGCLPVCLLAFVFSSFLFFLCACWFVGLLVCVLCLYVCLCARLFFWFAYMCAHVCVSLFAYLLIRLFVCSWLFVCVCVCLRCLFLVVCFVSLLVCLCVRGCLTDGLFVCVRLLM